jgi:2-keto-4-pentenoate hydratase
VSASQTVTETLLAARRERRPAPSAPLATALKNAAEAYAVQDAVAGAMSWFHTAVPQHWKSGGPSREAVLTHAPLPSAGVRSSGAAFDDWPMFGRAIEAEIALRLGSDVSPAQAAALRPEEVDGLIDAMAVSIEICDSRWLEGPQAPALLRLADLQSHAALVLGEWQPYRRRDWAAQTCEVLIGGAASLTRRGSHALGDPAWLLPIWLRHLTRHGQTVPAGTVVTTGTWVGMLPAMAGERVEVSFEGIGGAWLQL